MKTLLFPVILLMSDNFNGYLTKEAYNEVRLQMSTGDFHMHIHSAVISIDPNSCSGTEYLYDFDHETQELIEIGMVKDFVKGRGK